MWKCGGGQGTIRERGTPPATSSGAAVCCGPGDWCASTRLLPRHAYTPAASGTNQEGRRLDTRSKSETYFEPFDISCLWHPGTASLIPSSIVLGICLQSADCLARFAWNAGPVWDSVLFMRHSHACVHDLSHHSCTRIGAVDVAPVPVRPPTDGAVCASGCPGRPSGRTRTCAPALMSC